MNDNVVDEAKRESPAVPSEISEILPPDADPWEIYVASDKDRHYYKMCSSYKAVKDNDLDKSDAIIVIKDGNNCIDRSNASFQRIFYLEL